MKRAVEVVLFDSEEEYKKEYKKIYIEQNFTIFDIPVIFSEEDFDHIFSEPGKNTSQRAFSIRRAKKLMFIKAMLDQIAKIELTIENGTNNIAIFSIELECVIYLRIRPKTKSLQIRTFFDFGKDHYKMYEKQRRKCREISARELKEAVSSGPTTSRNADSFSKGKA